MAAAGRTLFMGCGCQIRDAYSPSGNCRSGRKENHYGEMLFARACGCRNQQHRMSEVEAASFWGAEDSAEEIQAKGGSLETQENTDCSMGSLCWLLGRDKPACPKRRTGPRQSTPRQVLFPTPKAPIRPIRPPSDPETASIERHTDLCRKSMVV